MRKSETHQGGDHHGVTPLGVILQIAVVGLALAVLGTLIWSIYHGLVRRGIPFSFAFLDQASGLRLTEGLTLDWSQGLALRPFEISDSNLQALLLGIFNTLKASIVGIALATVLGILLGVGRVSKNWMLNRTALAVVELIRNTPLLVQLFFWYTAVVLQLPPIRKAAHWYGSIISRNGIYLPSYSATDGWAWFWWLALASVIAIALFAGYGKRRYWSKTRIWGGAAAGVVIIWGAAILWRGAPLVPQYPQVSGFLAKGGINFTSEFSAILLALVVYTSAFIAEIVRGSIQAIGGGQWSAAYALGLRRNQAMNTVILPQAFRIMVPPLVNQYLNLTKNTSLGIAIGFSDLFNVYGTIANQTGRTMEGILFVMLAYLIINWIISLLMNIYNRRLLAKGMRT